MDKRIDVLETKISLLHAALLDVMDISSRYMPPEGQNLIDRVGQSLDKHFDALEDIGPSKEVE